MLRESQSTTRLATATEMGAQDFEKRLGLNNVQIVRLPEKVKGHDPTQFVEQWMTDIFDLHFGKEAHNCVRGRGLRVPARPLLPGLL